MILTVQRIQGFCLHDGPGIRTTVFLQGCPLRCWWCHNPATRPTESPSAERWPVTELIARCCTDRRWWQASGGGVTISGGEPLLQAEGLSAFLDELGEVGVDRCIETAGHVPWRQIDMVLPSVDRWLFDLKSAVSTTLRTQAGGDARRPIANLVRLLAACDTPVSVRIPLIHGVNDHLDEWDALAETIAALPRPVGVVLLPGHDLHVADIRQASVSPTTAETARAHLASRLDPVAYPVEICW